MLRRTTAANDRSGFRRGLAAVAFPALLAGLLGGCPMMPSGGDNLNGNDNGHSNQNANASGNTNANSGGGGNGNANGSGNGNANGGVTGPFETQLFIYDFDPDTVQTKTRRIRSWLNAEQLSAFREPDMSIQVTLSDQQFIGASFVVDGEGALVAPAYDNVDATSLNVFAEVAMADGPTDPARVVTGARTMLDSSAGLAYDRVRDLLYVMDNDEKELLVFADASTAAFNGDRAPTRVLTLDVGSATVGSMVLSTGDTLYIQTDLFENMIFAIDAVSTRSGIIAPSRTITSEEFRPPGTIITRVSAIQIDAADNLMALVAVGTAPNFVATFANAALLDGSVPATRLLEIPRPALGGFAVDANGIGYIACADDDPNSLFNHLLIYEDIAQLDGANAPDHDLAGEFSGIYLFAYNP